MKEKGTQTEKTPSNHLEITTTGFPTIGKKLHTLIWMLAVLCLASFHHAKAATWYVDAARPDDTGDGLSWSTAKKTIQAAIDAADDDDTVLVTNGTYNTGARVAPDMAISKTRVVIDKPLTVQSMNGPSNTFIVGEGPIGENAVRCVWMTNDTLLAGFTLTNGYTTVLNDNNGGGIYATSTNSTIVTNCTIIGCSADRYGGGAYQVGTLNNCTISDNSAYHGGGAYRSILNNCILTGNSASTRGGGTRECDLNNCTLADNSASYGGGAYRGILNNCTLADNSASTRGGATDSSTLNNCTILFNNNGAYNATLHNCIIYSNTEYNVSGGSTSFCCTNDPQFVDAANNNFQLLTDSPCINTGDNSYAPTNVSPYDLAGNPRIVGGIVDIGAYEFQGSNVSVTASAGEHGSVTPEGQIFTNPLGSITFTFTPDTYYQVADVVTNGSSTGLSGITEYAWSDIQTDGTLYVTFEEQVTVSNVPIWWLAQYGWTNDFETAALSDQDGDGLPTYREYNAQTVPTNANCDGDQFNDGVEVNTGANPLRDDSQTYGAVLSYPAQYNLYQESNICDLSYGCAMIPISNSRIRIQMQMQFTEYLESNDWQDVGTPLEWDWPVDAKDNFFRFHGF